MRSMVVAATIAAARVSLFAAGEGARPGEIDLSGKVVMVNEARRSLTINDGRNDMTLGVAPTVKNLGQIKPGSAVNFRCRQAVAIEIGKPRASAGRGEARVRFAPSGRGPAGPAPAEREVAALVENVDRRTREIWARSPDGRRLYIRVPPATPGFDDARVGESALIRYAEPLVLEIAPLNAP